MATVYQNANLARANLQATIGASATSFLVESGKWGLFPATWPFEGVLEQYNSSGAVIARETVTVTARTGDLFTITRATGAIPNTDASTSPEQTARIFDTSIGVVQFTNTLTKRVIDELFKIQDDAKVSVRNQEATYASATGAVNTYAVTITPAPVAYTTGMRVQFVANLANTEAATLNVNGLGAKTIRKLGGGTDLVSGDISLGMIVDCIYDGTVFEMQTPPANVPTSSIATQPWAYANDTGAANAYVIAPTPALGAYATGVRVSFKATNANTGASTINVSSLGVKNIVQPWNVALEPWVIQAGQMIDLEYDGTDFQLININNRIRLLGRLAAQAATSSTTEGTVLTLTIPANALGANGAIRIRWIYSMTAIVTSTGTIQAKYGATTVGSITCASSNLSSGTASMGSFEFVIMNTTASAQYCRANIDGVWNGTVSAIDSTRSGITVQSSTVATNAAITLTVTTQTSNASAPLTVYGVTAELIR